MSCDSQARWCSALCARATNGLPRRTPVELERQPRHGRSAWSARSIAAAAFAWVLLGVVPSWAAPEAHLLRIDPRASMVDGAPVLTTVVELVQHKRMSDITAACATMTGNAQLDCVADRLEQPQALYAPFSFPEKNAILTITVDGVDMPASFLSKDRWAKSKSQDGVGTAWLILVDAASSMGSRFPEARALAKGFVDAMGPQDIVDVMFFNDRAVVSDSKWLNSKATARNFVDSVARPYPAQGRTRPLFNIIKTAATDGFKELGNAGSKIKVPMHQAMVVLSNGASGADPSSPASAALALRQYLSKGRFPEDNATLPKAPVPVVSVWFPSRQIEEFYQNARQFMENLANPEIGGLHGIMRAGQSQRVRKIVASARMRFDQMHIVKWRVSCIAPQVNQTFKLIFKSTNPPIAGDNFIDVPVGIDPSTWPLDIDVDETVKQAKKHRVHPDGTVKVFGSFCWGGDFKRAQLYLIPNKQPAPESLEGASVEEAKTWQKKLTQSNMVGKALAAGDTWVEFEAPDSEKFLTGKGSKMIARMVVYDSRAHRSSAITADKILTLPAQEKPLNIWLIGGLSFGGVVLLLLVIGLLRGGGGKRRRAAARPRPVVAPGGAPAGQQPVAAPGPPAPGPAPMGPPPAFGPGMPPPPGPAGPAPGPAGPAPGPAGPAPGPVGAVAPPYAPGAALPPGPGVGPMAAPAAGPPMGPPAVAHQAILSGGPGIYPVTPGRELRVGRDPGMADICLTEPRISGMHATVKFEGGRLYVRDEGSNNGTFVHGGRIAAHAWSAVDDGGVLKFGPIEFSVRLE